MRPECSQTILLRLRHGAVEDFLGTGVLHLFRDFTFLLPLGAFPAQAGKSPKLHGFNGCAAYDSNRGASYKTLSEVSTTNSSRRFIALALASMPALTGLSRPLLSVWMRAGVIPRRTR